MEKLVKYLLPGLLLFIFTNAHAQKRCEISGIKVYAGDNVVVPGNYVNGRSKALKLPNGEFIIGLASNSSSGNFLTSCTDSIYTYQVFQKLSADGKQVLWEKCFRDKPGLKVPGIVIPRANGNLLSIIHNPSGSWGSAIVLELEDSTGNVLWSKTYGGLGFGSFYRSALSMPDGGLVIAVETVDSGADVGAGIGSTDIWILRVDSNGNKMWAQRFGGSNYDFVHDLAYAPNEGVYLAGGTQSQDSDFVSNHNSTADTADAYIMRLDSLGRKLWARCFGGSNVDYFMSATADGNGGVLAVGSTFSSDGDVQGYKGTVENLWAVKADSNGTLSWNKCFASTYRGTWQEAWHTCLAADSSLWIAGLCYYSGDDVDTSYGGFDIWALHVSGRDGSLINSRVLGSSDDNFPGFMFPVPDGVVIGGNYSLPDGTFSSCAAPSLPNGINAALIFLGPNSVDVKSINGTTPEWSVSPIPADNDVRLSYNLAGAAQVSIRMSDLLGNLLWSSPTQHRIPGRHEQIIPTQDHAAGIYILQLSVNGSSSFNRVQILH